jgi:hypothetical protein
MTAALALDAIVFDDAIYPLNVLDLMRAPERAA